MFLYSPKLTRKRATDAAQANFVAALAAVGLFGREPAVCTDDEFCLGDVFCLCQCMSKANAEKNNRLANIQDFITPFATEYTTNTDEEFHFVEKELVDLSASQTRTAANQD